MTPAERSLQRLQTDYYPWHGMLCVENAEAIAARLEAMLGSGRYHSFVDANSWNEHDERYTSVAVKTSLRLTRPVSATVEDGHVHISIVSDRLVCGLHTRARTQAEGRVGKPHDFVQVGFERHQIQVEHYAPAGYRLLWIFSVEDHDQDHDEGGR